MVYKSLTSLLHKIPHQLQHNCLLCRCSIRANRSKSTEPSIFGLCHHCEASLPHITHHCRHCAIPLDTNTNYCGQCLQKAPLFTAAHCAVKYQGDIPGLIHQLKHQHNKATNRLLAELFIQSLPDKLPAIDMIVPVPMHTKRNLQRGNNQSALLSQSICKKLQIEHNGNLLKRTQFTPTQQGLSAKQRRNNLKNIFAVQQPVKNFRIAVLDDVITTGSTMNEIARTLKQAGASEVYAWAVARTPKHCN